MAPSRYERLEGGLLGLLVGDALGVPYELQPPAQLPERAAIEMVPPLWFSRSHVRIPPGTWSDDGAQALCLLSSLVEYGRFDAADFASRLLAWFDTGYMAVERVVFDVGLQTGRALDGLRRGANPLEAGPRGERDNGNGSLMRALPVALWHRGGDGALVGLAHDQSRVTHGHPRSLACCALYCLWARRILEEAEQPFESAVATLRRIYAHEAALLAELEGILAAGGEVRPGGGYVVDCLWSAYRACQLPSYEAIAKEAVAMGEDTDTTACVAGGIAGLIHGVGGIPERWRTALRGQELLTPMLRALHAR